MELVYIAGAFRNETYWGMYQNVRRAEQKALELWSQGYAVICPHLNTANFQGALPDRVWLEGCLEIVKRCDTIYMMRGYKLSEGSVKELKLAHDLGRTILYE